MKFDKLKTFNKTKLIISGTIISCLILVITIFVSHSKYVYKDNITIMEGNINYKPYDFKIMAMYIPSNDGYTEVEQMPSSKDGYTINEQDSYCYIDNEENHETGITLKTNEAGEHIIGGLSKKSKCVLYFDKAKSASEKSFDELASLNTSLESKGRLGEDGFTDVETEVSENQVYEAEDNDGTSYYFRGDVLDNYVKFGKTGTEEDTGDDIWWRIIRINGDGSIRMTYAGTSSDEIVPNQRAGNTTMINDGQVYQFNTKQNDNMYVGFEYVSGIRNGHTNNNGGGIAEKSDALKELNIWFDENLKDEFNNGVDTLIDTNAGFCGDRSAYSGYTEDTKNNEIYGVNKQITYYGSHIRNCPNGIWPVISNPAYPTYKCEDENDLYTYIGSNKGTKSLEYPIGLISADEVTYAGGLGNKSNISYYLYNSTEYWTMSPSAFNGRNSGVFSVFSSGKLDYYIDVYGKPGLRPVINLKSNSITKGTGEASTPFEV